MLAIMTAEVAEGMRQCLDLDGMRQVGSDKYRLSLTALGRCRRTICGPHTFYVFGHNGSATIARLTHMRMVVSSCIEMREFSRGVWIKAHAELGALIEMKAKCLILSASPINMRLDLYWVQISSPPDVLIAGYTMKFGMFRSGGVGLSGVHRITRGSDNAETRVDCGVENKAQ